MEGKEGGDDGEKGKGNSVQESGDGEVTHVDSKLRVCEVAIGSTEAAVCTGVGRPLQTLHNGLPAQTYDNYSNNDKHYICRCPQFYICCV